MNLLLDTHILIWALNAPARLNALSRAAIEDRQNTILFSSISILEIAIKSAQQKQDFGVRAEEVIQFARNSSFVELPLSAMAASAVGDLPLHHHDPFDRVLLAQAMTEPARLLTVDTKLARYSDLVWLQPH